MLLFAQGRARGEQRTWVKPHRQSESEKHKHSESAMPKHNESARHKQSQTQHIPTLAINNEPDIQKEIGASLKDQAQQGKKNEVSRSGELYENSLGFIQEIEEVRADNYRLKNELNKLSHDIKEKHALAENLKSEIANEREEWKSKRQELLTNIEELKSKLSNVNFEVEKVQRSNDELTKIKDILKNAQIELENTKRALEMEKKAREEEDKEKVIVQQEKKTLESLVQQLKTSFDLEQKKNTEQCNILSKENADLKEQIDLKAKEYKKQIDELQLESMKMKTELSMSQVIQSEKSELSEQIEMFQLRIANLEKDNLRLEKESKENLNSFNETKTINDEMTKELDNLRASIENSKRSEAEFKISLETLQKEKEALELKSKVNSTVQQKKAPEDSDLQKKIADLEEDLIKERNSKKTLADGYQSKIAALNSKVHDMIRLRERQDQLKKERESQMDISQLAEIDLCDYIFQLDRQIRQLTADKVTLTQEFNKKMTELTSENQLLKDQKENLEAIVGKESLEEKVNKVYEKLKIKTNSFNDTKKELLEKTQRLEVLEKLYDDVESRFEKKYEELSVLLRDLEIDVNLSKENKVTSVISYLKSKNSILSKRYTSLEEQYKKAREDLKKEGVSLETAQKIDSLQKKLIEAEEEFNMINFKLTETMMKFSTIEENIGVFKRAIKVKKVKVPDDLMKLLIVDQ